MSEFRGRRDLTTVLVLLGVVGHQFVCPPYVNLATDRTLEPHQAERPSELKYPVQAASAWGESITLCNYEQGLSRASTCGYHRPERVDLGMHVVRPKNVLDVASREYVTVTRKR
jgi:hypothetical protein